MKTSLLTAVGVMTLTPTVVRAAELRIGPGGTEFESVWLVR